MMMESPVPPSEMPEAVDLPAPEFGPSRTLRELSERAASEARPDPLPDSLPLSAVEMLPELFQARGAKFMDPQHVGALERGLKINGLLEPLTVVWVGSRAYLVDGHHRHAAYEAAKFKGNIPVTAFSGTVEEAILHAGRANTRDKLRMSSQQKQDFGWSLVLLGTFSKKAIVESSGVSDGQVANMRRIRVKLGEKAGDYRSWWQALKASKGELADPMTDDERDLWIDAQAQHYADRLAKAFSSKLSRNPEIAARALSIYFGRTLPDVMSELEAFLPEPDEDDEQERDF